MKNNKSVILVGCSGHSLVVAEALFLSGYKLIGYLNKNKDESNRLNTKYFGYEEDNLVLQKMKGTLLFPAIGDNIIREKVINFFEEKGFEFVTVVHPKSNVSQLASIGRASLICQGASINPYALIGKGVIINTGAIIEHECIIGDYAHIAPGAVLAGNVSIGKSSFIGANAVVKQGVTIGMNVTLGAGTVVLRDIKSSGTFVGNPAKSIRR